MVQSSCYRKCSNFWILYSWMNLGQLWIWDYLGKDSLAAKWLCWKNELSLNPFLPLNVQKLSPSFLTPPPPISPIKSFCKNDCLRDEEPFRKSHWLAPIHSFWAHFGFNCFNYMYKSWANQITIHSF